MDAWIVVKWISGWCENDKQMRFRVDRKMDGCVEE